MSNPVLPVIAASPAIITFNSKSFYAKSGINRKFLRDTFKVTSDLAGQLDERMKSQRQEISFTPDGQISDLGKYFPYAAGDIGKSLFGTSDSPLVVVTKFGGTSNAGQTLTYPRAALTKLSPLFLGSQKTLFGDMAFTCLGDPTVQSNTSNAWETIASSTFADATFDETKIVTDIYTAAYGSSPYNSMGAMSGFTLDIALEKEDVTADDFGIVDMFLKSLTATAKFIPSNLTETQISTLLGLQGTGYVFPGQSLSKNNTDLVVTGSGNNGLTLTATIKNAGPKQASFNYDVGKHRLMEVEFSSKRTWTSGAANALWTLAVA